MTVNGLLTTGEAAEKLGVSDITVGRWARDGTLEPAEKVPGGRGSYLFDPAKVDRLERKRRLGDAAVQADALRDAAELLSNLDYANEGVGVSAIDNWTARDVVDWLRRHADAIEAEETDETRRQQDRRELAERFASQEETRAGAIDEVADLL